MEETQHLKRLIVHSTLLYNRHNGEIYANSWAFVSSKLPPTMRILERGSTKCNYTRPRVIVRSLYAMLVGVHVLGMPTHAHTGNWICGDSLMVYNISIHVQMYIVSSINSKLFSVESIVCLFIFPCWLLDFKCFLFCFGFFKLIWIYYFLGLLFWGCFPPHSQRHTHKIAIGVLWTLIQLLINITVTAFRLASGYKCTSNSKSQSSF